MGGGARRWRLAAVSWAIVGCGCAGGEPPARDGIDRLSGSAGDSALEHIPELAFPPAKEDDFDWFDGPAGSIGLSRTEICLALADGVTVGEANDLLASLSARIIGAEPESTLLLLRLPEAPDTRPILAARDRLLADRRVAAASIEDAVMRVQRLPPNTTDDRVLVPERGPNWLWDSRIDSSGGNWGLEAARFPQVWNLSDYLASHGRLPDVGVLDSGFTPLHEDLGGFVPESNTPDGANRDHGTMVVGIIRADWDNELGVAGALALPVTVHARTDFGVEHLSAHTLEDPASAVAQARNLLEIIDVIKAGARVVNNSYGINEYCPKPQYPPPGAPPASPCLDPAVTSPPWESSLTWSRYVDLLGDVYHVGLRRLAGGHGRRKFLLVSSAGNCGTWAAHHCRSLPTSFEFRARDNSPLANLAVRYPALTPDSESYYVTVGATQPGGGPAPFNPASFSTREPTLSAPGDWIRSTEDDEAAVPGRVGVELDRSPTAPAADGVPLYATGTGTSFAAPFVTALATYLWALDPDLTPAEVRRLMIDTADAVGQIDAFAAMLAADAQRPTPELVRALADLDDGPVGRGGSADGNLRWRITDPGCETHDAAAATRCEVTGAPARRGDGIVDIRDFRVLRDAMVEDVQFFSRAENLDGGSDNPLKDLNQDHCVTLGILPSRSVSGRATVCDDPIRGRAPAESVFARADLNGDGTLSIDATAPFVGADPSRPRDLTDLGVMQSVWGTEAGAVTLGYTAAQLTGLLDSGDIHLDFGALPPAIDSVELEVTGLPGSLPITDLERGDTVVTVPAGSIVTVTARAIVLGVRIACLETTLPALARGQDVVARPDTSCDAPAFRLVRRHAASQPNPCTRSSTTDSVSTAPTFVGDPSGTGAYGCANASPGEVLAPAAYSASSSGIGVSGSERMTISTTTDGDAFVVTVTADCAALASPVDGTYGNTGTEANVVFGIEADAPLDLDTYQMTYSCSGDLTTSGDGTAAFYLANRSGTGGGCVVYSATGTSTTYSTPGPLAGAASTFEFDLGCGSTQCATPECMGPQVGASSGAGMFTLRIEPRP